MADDTSALDRLAVRMGIEPEYRDARGETVRIGTETKRALLAAMGQPAETDAEADASLVDRERRDWVNILPPVMVVRADAGRVDIDLVLPAGTMETVVWRLELEDGGNKTGRIAFGQLEWIASVDLDEQRLERRRLTLEDGLPWGYHRLTVEPGHAFMTLIVTPGRCWLPEELANGGRLWGIAAQLYLLRSDNDWGIGDFTDLRQLVKLAASRGAALIGLNPLHALFFDDPNHVSPYSPASRLMLNVLNIDVTAIPELRSRRALIDSKEFQRRIEDCRAKHLVDYAAVAKLKLSTLENLFEACRTDRSRSDEFERFREERGEELERYCVFVALREHFLTQDPSLADWHRWPKAFHRWDTPEVMSFSEKNRHRVDFLAWLQFIADEQLHAAAGEAAREGMAVGIYRDLAIGGDPHGVEIWADAETVVSGARVGAPPDIYNPQGQDWGLPPAGPHALRQQGYRSFIELIRANMRHAGALRIDHVMGLRRLWWVPAGKQSADGGYVAYPTKDLVGILALESHRRHCLVIGEDLGTVPEGFREQMAEANILSYRVLFFEQDGASGEFHSPADYPGRAIAVAGSHDLPTLRAWWDGSDLDLKRRLHLYPGPEDELNMRASRERDRSGLLLAFRRQGLLSPRDDPDAVCLSRVIHGYLARSSAMLAMAQIDDLTGEVDPVNVPTTSTEHPNWRRRLRMTLEELAADPDFNNIADIFNAGRSGHG